MKVQAVSNDVKATYGEQQSEMERYLVEGEKRALALGNRGPIRYNKNGSLHEDILESYWETGFYVFTDVLDKKELLDIEKDVNDFLECVPISEESILDQNGNRAITSGLKARNLFWATPLSDPFGGTDIAGGRHPAKMFEPTPTENAPEKDIYLILGSLQFSEACLRVYGHPDLLRVAEAINGKDFTPFNEALFIKRPGIGASVAWHQDGLTHWDSPRWDYGTHGFNFMAQVYGSTAANGLWVVPGTHKLGKLDIKKLVSEAGTDRLPEAVPMLCAPGDVGITNRQALHGSFANVSENTRLTVNFGFHRRESVLGVTAGGVHNARATYDEKRIKERSRLIPYAIDARRQKYPNESSYIYAPLADEEDKYRWNAQAKVNIRDYNLQDLSI